MDSTKRFVAWAPPLLRWAGSKRKLLPILSGCAPKSFRRYLEPFAGSACLFFALRPRAGVLGDMNEEIMETYSIIRSHPRLVARTALQWQNSEATYYALRSAKVAHLDPVQRAARFLYLNRHCFNGVYRTNRQGEFNVPRGTRTGEIPAEATVYRCSVALRSADLRPGDFENCVRDVRERDFVYLDPPYAQTERPTFGEYGYDGFNTRDLGRLVDCLSRIDAVGAVFLLSYSDTSGLLRMLNRSWHVRKLQVRRHVAGFARHRTKVSEILASNRPF